MKKLATMQFSDFTEQEFIAFVEKIKMADYRTESQHDDAIYHFARITEHPEGWDLIYHPEPGTDKSASGVVNTVKSWRAANGKHGFKPD